VDSTGGDTLLRQAAFDHVNLLAVVRNGILDSADLAAGFEFAGQRIPLVNPQRGIFKPRQMAGLLSIRTVFPRQGGRVWYDDQRDAHRQIYAGDFLPIGRRASRAKNDRVAGHGRLDPHSKNGA
jgi:putative restriction endonuclease